MQQYMRLASGFFFDSNVALGTPFGLAEGTKVPRIALALVLKRKHPWQITIQGCPIISLLTLIGLGTERLSRKPLSVALLRNI
jgi:hypothetical protein